MELGLTTNQKGYLRDKQILQLIENCQALNTDQIRNLVFKNCSHGARKARERLLKLYKSRRVKRCRYSLTEPYCYFVGRKHGRLEHLLELNWVYVWLVNGLKSWEQIQCFSHEYNLGILQADAFAGIRNTVTGKIKFYFVEMDRSDNDFDKVEKYNRWYESDGYAGQWWTDLADRFPVILVVTTTASRRARIMERIKRENTRGLEFKVLLLSEIEEG